LLPSLLCPILLLLKASLGPIFLILIEVDLLIGVDRVLFPARVVEVRGQVLDGFAHACLSAGDVSEEVLLGRARFLGGLVLLHVGDDETLRHFAAVWPSADL
jgi:hypothetical protein